MIKSRHIPYVAASALAIVMGVFVIYLLARTFEPVRQPQSEKAYTTEDVRQQYDALFEEMIKELAANPSVRYLSTTAYVTKHRNFNKILSLGRPAVPLAVAGVRDNKLYSVEILRGLLPDIRQQLRTLYDENYASDFEKDKATWLRWWDEYGSHEQWDSK